MEQVYISIGSNIDPKNNISLAKSKLKKVFTCIFSDTFHSRSSGFQGEDFSNLVAGFQTTLDPLKVKEVLKEIEKEMGRDDYQKGMANRVIDLDLILFGKFIIQDKSLSLPSEDIERYPFVLEPFVQIAGNEIHPILNISYKEMLLGKKVR